MKQDTRVAAAEPAGSSAWADRIGDPRYAANQTEKQRNESALWADKGKQGNLWEARDEAGPQLIGNGREDAGPSGAAPQPRAFDPQAAAPSASVLAMEAFATSLQAKPNAEDDDAAEEDDDVSGEDNGDEEEEDDEEESGDEEGGVEKEQVNFKTTGTLAAETNKINGVVVKFQVPPEARLPSKRWRLYVFKGDEVIEPIPIHRMTYYLFGKERKVAHIPSDNPSVSSQHAVLCYRLVDAKKTKQMDKTKVVVPYLMDLNSTNGTFLNNKKIEAEKFHELREGDALQFGQSTKKYLLLHEDSKL